MLVIFLGGDFNSLFVRSFFHLFVHPFTCSCSTSLHPDFFIPFDNNPLCLPILTQFLTLTFTLPFVVAIFHASFHPTKGNIVDWSVKAYESESERRFI